MMRKAFAVPGFTRLFVGLAASMFGDSLMLIVLSMWVKQLTGSNAAAGLTFLWLCLPALVGPAFGYLVDRVARRGFLVVANLLSAVAMLPLLAVHDASDVWIIYLVALLYGVSFVVVPAALNGLLKDMLPEDLLVEANSSLSVTREAFRLVGPLAGASLFAFLGGGSVALVDALSFVVAAVAVGTIVVVEQRHEHEPVRWLTGVGAGLAHIRRTPTLLHGTMSLAICLLVVGFSESAVYAVVDAFGKPVEFVGPVVSVQGVGAIVGGLLSGKIIRRTGEPAALLAGLSMLVVGLLGVAGSQAVWELLVSVAALGAGLPVLIVAYTTLLQKQTPGHLMGRVSTTTDVLITTPQALSIATGALLVTLLDYRVIFLLMAAGTLTAATYLATMLRGRLGPVTPHSAAALAHPAEAQPPVTQPGDAVAESAG